MGRPALEIFDQVRGKLRGLTYTLRRQYRSDPLRFVLPAWLQRTHRNGIVPARARNGWTAARVPFRIVDSALKGKFFVASLDAHDVDVGPEVGPEVESEVESEISDDEDGRPPPNTYLVDLHRETDAALDQLWETIQDDHWNWPTAAELHFGFDMIVAAGGYPVSTLGFTTRRFDEMRVAAHTLLEKQLAKYDSVEIQRYTVAVWPGRRPRGEWIPVPTAVSCRLRCINPGPKPKPRKELNDCFRWAALACLHGKDVSHPERRTAYKKFVARYKWDGINFPSGEDDLDRFTELNNEVQISTWSLPPDSTNVADIEPRRIRPGSKINLLSLDGHWVAIPDPSLLRPTPASIGFGTVVGKCKPDEEFQFAVLAFAQQDRVTGCHSSRMGQYDATAFKWPPTDTPSHQLPEAFELLNPGHSLYVHVYTEVEVEVEVEPPGDAEVNPASAAEIRSALQDKLKEVIIKEHPEAARMRITALYSERTPALVKELRDVCEWMRWVERTPALVKELRNLYQWMRGFELDESPELVQKVQSLTRFAERLIEDEPTEDTTPAEDTTEDDIHIHTKGVIDDWKMADMAKIVIHVVLDEENNRWLGLPNPGTITSGQYTCHTCMAEYEKRDAFKEHMALQHAPRRDDFCYNCHNDIEPSELHKHQVGNGGSGGCLAMPPQRQIMPHPTIRCPDYDATRPKIVNEPCGTCGAVAVDRTEVSPGGLTVHVYDVVRQRIDGPRCVTCCESSHEPDFKCTGCGQTHPPGLCRDRAASDLTCLFCPKPQVPTPEPNPRPAKAEKDKAKKPCPVCRKLDDAPTYNVNFYGKRCDVHQERCIKHKGVKVQKKGNNAKGYRAVEITARGAVPGNHRFWSQREMAQPFVGSLDFEAYCNPATKQQTAASVGLTMSGLEKLDDTAGLEPGKCHIERGDNLPAALAEILIRLSNSHRRYKEGLVGADIISHGKCAKCGEAVLSRAKLKADRAFFDGDKVYHASCAPPPKPNLVSHKTCLYCLKPVEGKGCQPVDMKTGEHIAGNCHQKCLREQTFVCTHCGCQDRYRIWNSANRRDQPNACRHHDHGTTAFVGLSHPGCNLADRVDDLHMVIYVHNLKYDVKFLFGLLAYANDLDKRVEAKGEIEPWEAEWLEHNQHKNMFKIQASEDVKSPKAVYFAGIKFQCSLSLFSASLASVLDDLTPEQKPLLAVMGVEGKQHFPYTALVDASSWDEPIPTDPQAYYNDLRQQKVDPEELAATLAMADKRGFTTIAHLHDHYLRADVLGLQDATNFFRTQAISEFGLDPANFTTGPSFSDAVMQKVTRTPLKLVSNPTVHTRISQSIRGGFSGANKRKCTTVNSPLLSGYDESQPSTILMYLDANSLYPTAMSLPLPTAIHEEDLGPERGEEFMNPTEWQQDGMGAFLECTVEYPEALHELFDDLPPVPDVYDGKLCATLLTKRVMLHYVQARQARKLGCVVTVHGGYQFEQSAWMQPFTLGLASKRLEAKRNGQVALSQFYKILLNSSYGYQLLRLRGKCKVEHIKTVARLMAQSDRIRSVMTLPDDSIFACCMEKAASMTSPEHIGAAILCLSKVLMYDFLYTAVYPCFGHENVAINFTDTDSFMLEIRSDTNPYEMIKNSPEMMARLDTGAIKNKANPLYGIPSGKHPFFELYDGDMCTLGLFKDEEGGYPILEAVSLRPKVHAHRVQLPDKIAERVVCKGVSVRGARLAVPEDAPPGTEGDRIGFRHLVQVLEGEGDARVLYANENRLIASGERTMIGVVTEEDVEMAAIEAEKAHEDVEMAAIEAEKAQVEVDRVRGVFQAAKKAERLAMRAAKKTVGADVENDAEAARANVEAVDKVDKARTIVDKARTTADKARTIARECSRAVTAARKRSKRVEKKPAAELYKGLPARTCATWQVVNSWRKALTCDDRKRVHSTDHTSAAIGHKKFRKV